jgi:uncharacterized membrane protein YjjB (DUF3815 family)
MSWNRLRWLAFVTLCGGTVFQTTTGCNEMLAPIVSSLVTSLVSGIISNMFLTT